MSENNKVPNRLIEESSPYLLQHAYNPVDWYPWGAEAFEKARREDKPIFLSIGYSVCHWCHAMAHECFEDQEVAELLNREFVCIKVDKEERPDVDAVYMAVCQIFTGQGGWPCTIFTDPEGKPFFAGTYFPKKKKYGTMGLMELLPLAAESWKNNRKELEKTANEVLRLLRGEEKQASEDAGKTEGVEAGIIGPGGFDQLADEEYDRLVAEARRGLEQNFDETYGGFGDKPKFPLPHNLLFLLGLYQSSGRKDEKALEMAETTLQAMYKGGIFDHIGGGFCRYSTDETWLAPHFEKMLYDNALLALTYIEAYRITGRGIYRTVAERTLDYVLRELRDEDGGFCAAQDADSAGEEGRFYTFTVSELSELLGERSGKLFCDYYNITEQGNFEGKNIPNLLEEPEVSEEVEKTIEGLRDKVLYYRAGREALHRDDKVLTGWNGLMMAALARGYQVLKNRSYLNAAEEAARMIRSRLVKEGRLMVGARAGKLMGTGFLEDYAFVAMGLLYLYEATGRMPYLQQALDLTRDMTDLFFDQEQGGFFMTAVDQEPLIVRRKETYDGAVPSGNSVAAFNLVCLERKLSGEVLLETAAKQLDFLKRKTGSGSGPAGFCFAMLAFLSTGEDLLHLRP